MKKDKKGSMVFLVELLLIALPCLLSSGTYERWCEEIDGCPHIEVGCSGDMAFNQDCQITCKTAASGGIHIVEKSCEAPEI